MTARRTDSRLSALDSWFSAELHRKEARDADPTVVLGHDCSAAEISAWFFRQASRHAMGYRRDGHAATFFPNGRTGALDLESVRVGQRRSQGTADNVEARCHNSRPGR